MKLIVLGSNSSGNCYLLEGNDETLIIEAGIKMSEVKKALKFNLRKVAGAVISHEHNDHAGYVKDFVSNAIMTLAPISVFNKKGVDHQSSFSKAIEVGKGYKVGGFKILPLQVSHDVPCVGYIIDHSEMGRLLFVTDTMMLEYTIPGLNHLLIEANYADDILNRNIEAGSVLPSMRERLLFSHMEIETTKEILRNNDLSNVSNIVLIHLSNGNSDEKRFLNEVSRLTGIPTYIAVKNLQLDLSLNTY